ncbi:MAG: phosphoribosylaminoimidazolesuccinocarboxamide synthase [Gammaproteobacteria bacterium]|nr:phosphoribosylaminoimidazolesuccinocarboxamide synthase [Gammaproteobacteria bacterium]
MTSEQQQAVFETSLQDLPLIYRGKVRDLYALDDARLLIVATDRISAFDVVMPTPIPGKGKLLTRISNFWFARFARLVDNHLLETDATGLGATPGEREMLRDRAVIVRRLRPLPVEAIVRGYLIGSGWKDYRSSGAVSGVTLAKGLRIAEQLPAPVFTPSTKAQQGEHDENIDFAAAAAKIGARLAERVRDLSLQIYREAAEHARRRGIIIADTKFEFGLDDDDRVVLMDEVLTPDSSRFWPADAWRPGHNPPSYDKQFVRDFLETLDWGKVAPGPALPADIVAQTAAKYHEAVQRLTDDPPGATA